VPRRKGRVGVSWEEVKLAPSIVGREVGDTREGGFRVLNHQLPSASKINAQRSGGSTGANREMLSQVQEAQEE